MAYLPFVLFGLTFLSGWIRRDPKIWGPLLGFSLLTGMIAGYLGPIAILATLGWGSLWLRYENQQTHSVKIALFSALIFLSFAFKLHLIPGFHPLHIASKFYLGFDSPLIGLFPFLLVVPLAKNLADWKEALFKGFWPIVIGLSVMAALTLSSGTIHWEYKLPSFWGTRYLANLLFVVAEEAFYRGFIMGEFIRFSGNRPSGKWIALFLSSFLFTLGHIYWSPNLAIFFFVFLAGLLYGGIYLRTRRIESSILCHFILNFLHMTFFSYHAM